MYSNRRIVSTYEPVAVAISPCVSVRRGREGGVAKSHGEVTFYPSLLESDFGDPIRDFDSFRP